MKDREFGGHACLGIAPPQSNPVVEPEFSVLLPDGVSMLVTRLVGNRGNSRQRFHQYLDNLETSLEAFGAAEIDAFGLALLPVAENKVDAGVGDSLDKAFLHKVEESPRTSSPAGGEPPDIQHP